MSRRHQIQPAIIPIALAQDSVRTHGIEHTTQAIQRVVCSVRFSLTEDENAFRILGPDMAYHEVDRYLPEAFEILGTKMIFEDLLEFKSVQDHFDFYLEDSWTGYFIARRFKKQSEQHRLVLIHLDDHTDMMTTLLLVSEHQQLVDPTSGAIFDPTSEDSWESAIYSGSINIGNYITPFFYTDCTVDVRHVRNVTDEDGMRCIFRESREYPLIPDKQFASLRKATSDSPKAVGTYLGGADPDVVLKGLPNGWTILHIDLDYFINDFNGASRGTAYCPDPILRTIALDKMNLFFAALARVSPTIDRWLIGASPGFCSGYHWRFLLLELSERIEAFHSRQNA